MRSKRAVRVIEGRLGLGGTVTVLGGGGNPAGWWEVGGKRTRHDSRGSADNITSLAQGNDYVGLTLDTTVTSPASAWWAPVETISNSESGFERVYQGSGLLLSWPLRLPPGASFRVTVSHVATTARDRSAEEEAAKSAVSPATPGGAAPVPSAFPT